jgi:hypothetical protein
MALGATMRRTLLAATVPLVGMLVLAGPAGAHKVTGVGSVTCSYGDSMTFSPPLAPGSGTAGYSKEVITLRPASIGSCSGTVTSGGVPSLGTGTKARVFKIKGGKIGGVYHAGSCLSFENFLWPKFKANYDWTVAGLMLKGSKVSHMAAESISNPTTGDLGFQFSGTATGSFSGRVTIDAYFTNASSGALEDCVANEGTVSSLTVDPTQSTVTLG